MNTILQYPPAILLTCITLLLSGCGQTGGLFLPGQGSGYYKTHEFTERPVHAAPLIKHHKDTTS